MFGSRYIVSRRNRGVIEYWGDGGWVLSRSDALIMNEGEARVIAMSFDYTTMIKV